jgi:hypothetical protein
MVAHGWRGACSPRLCNLVRPAQRQKPRTGAMQRGAAPPSGVAGSAESGGFVRRVARRLLRPPQDRLQGFARIVFRRRLFRSPAARPIGRGAALHDPASADPDAGRRDARLA